jgi:hypothetical protein
MPASSAALDFHLHLASSDVKATQRQRQRGAQADVAFGERWVV